MSLIVETLMLQAKTAILDDQLSRHQAFAREGRVQEALRQTHTVLKSVLDILRDSNKVLENVSQGRVDPPAQR